MSVRTILSVLGVGLCSLFAPLTLPADDLQFNRDIRPILSANCFACHGFDAKKREADLRLDVPDDAFAPRDGKTAIKPGDLTGSELWRRIVSDDPNLVMPPPSSRKALTAAEKDTLKRWIEQGAVYQKHWAFEAPVVTTPPEVASSMPGRNEIDRFIFARLAAAKLAPNAEADRPTLIRRVAFTLTGLPPTVAEVEVFLADKSSTAYEAMVDRYLASPRYGEEMARHWLDIARYADTHGLHLDNEREMWAYRDWVISAFNRNLPFDQFTVEQLAGDLLPNPTKDQLIATGFNRCNVTTSEGGSIAEEFLYRYAVERASTTAQAWVGLTGGCAVCHDHKYDPLTMKEFYSLYAFFYSSADPAMDGNVRYTPPFLSLATPSQEEELQRLKAEEQTARQRRDQILAAIDDSDPADNAAEEPTREVVDVWFDDLIPVAQRVSTTSRNKAAWSNRGGEIEIPSGLRSLKQYGGELYQDQFDGLATTWVIPENGEIELWVRTDVHEPPDAMLLQLTTSRGIRRLLLGDNSKLGGGGPATDERLIRDLPQPGEWTTLRIGAKDWRLQPGDMVRGLTFEEFGGVCWWDGLKIRGQLKPKADPRESFRAWWMSRKGQETTGVPGHLAELLKSGPATTAVSVDGPADARNVVNSAENLKRQSQTVELKRYFLANIARPSTAEWQRAQQDLETAMAARTAMEDSIPGTFTFNDLATPRDAFVMMRGQYDKPADKVDPAVPAIFPPLKLPEGRTRANRLDLANWLVSTEHPTTARVAVNRFWQQVFGVGLVKTSDDFGSQGEPPSHPELLDWLAVWYRDHGWDTKALMRLLVTSAAFRQEATVTAEDLAVDPQNRLYARGPRFRFDAEQVRDNALFVSGLLNLKMGGPGVKPYQPPNLWEPVGYANSNTRYFIQDHGDDLYRRSIYCFLKRTAPPPFMSNFDGPNREQLCARRERSNTPLQALQTLNDTQHVEAARAFAERILTTGGGSPQERIAFAYRTVLSREPAAPELELVARTLQTYLRRYQSDSAAAERLIHVGESRPKIIAAPAELAAYTLIANLILNLDETLNRN